jgi:hypothetical protein
MVRQQAKFIVALFCLSVVSAAEACPVIDGIFERPRREGETSVRGIGLNTLRKGREYSYKFFNMDDFQRADKVKRSLRWGDWSGTMTLACWENTLLQETQEDGSNTILTSYINVIDKNTIEIVSDAGDRGGRYRRVK